MSVDSVKSGLIDVVESAITGVTVYPHVLWCFGIDEVPTDAQNNVHWWEVYLANVIPTQIAYGVVALTYTFYVDGFLSVTGSGESQATFEAEVESIVNKILENQTFGGSAEMGDIQGGPVGTGLPSCSFGTALLRTRSGVTLHQARITVNIRDKELKELST